MGDKALADHGPIDIMADRVVRGAKDGVMRWEGNVEMVGDVRELNGVQVSAGADADSVSRPLEALGPIGPDSPGRFILAADSLEIRYAINSDGSLGKMESMKMGGQTLLWRKPVSGAH
jgi:hypothetical protein